MHLTKENMNLIEGGKKTLEIRLLDEKRQTMKIGDEIVFTEIEEPDRLVKVIITDLIIKPTFEELFTAIDLKSAGWSENTSVEKACQDMRQYYSEEEEQKFGVLAIKINLVVV